MLNVRSKNCCVYCFPIKRICHPNSICHPNNLTSPGGPGKPTPAWRHRQMSPPWSVLCHLPGLLTCTTPYLPEVPVSLRSCSPEGCFLPAWPSLLLGFLSLCLSPLPENTGTSECHPALLCSLPSPLSKLLELIKTVVLLSPTTPPFSVLVTSWLPVSLSSSPQPLLDSFPGKLFPFPVLLALPCVHLAVPHVWESSPTVLCLLLHLH